jgi:hypothetical protein
MVAGAAKRGVDGNFMRIEVISMLKLVVITTLFITAAGTFVLIGFGNGPPTQKSDWVGDRKHCSKEVSFAYYEECAAMSMVKSRAGNSGNAIEEMFHFSVNEQIALMNCLFEKCEVTNDVSYTTPTADKLGTLHFQFVIDKMQQNNRFFYVEMAFPNVPSEPRRDPRYNDRYDDFLEVTITSQVRAFYKNASNTSANAYVELLPDDRQKSLKITCPPMQDHCHSSFFLRFTDILYESYQVRVMLNTTANLPYNGTEVAFRVHWGNAEFTNWMIGFKLFFLLLSIVSVVTYNRALSILSLREQNMEQVWVLTLGVLLCFFNDPFYIFEANYGGNHFKVLSIIFQNTFFHTLLLFWLVALDNMRLQGVERGVSNYRFYTPKVIFMLSFWGVTTTTHCYMKYYSNNDPTWDPLEDNDGFHWARTIVWILSGVYWIWLILLVVGSHREVRAKRSRFRYLLFLTFVMILLSFSGLLIEANSPSPRSAGIWTSFHALFNMYIFALSYLFAPSATTIKNAQNMKGEDRPALQGEIMDPSTIEIRDKISGEVNGDSSFVVA